MLEKEQVYKELLRCNKCGGCQVICPTYKATYYEGNVARGRLFLVRKYLESGEQALLKTPEIIQSLEQCLLCESCTKVCPSGVRTAEVVLYYRQQLLEVKGAKNKWKERLYRLAFLNKAFIPLAAKLAYYYQKFGVIPDPYQLRSFLSQYLDGQVLRDNPGTGITLPATGQRKYKVTFFVGCASNTFYHRAALAAINLLRRWADVTLLDNYCCGAPLLSLGAVDGFREVASRNLELISREQTDFIVTDCSTCASVLKQYPARLGVAVPVMTKLRDLVEILIQEREHLSPVKGSGRQKFTFHYPCHLARGQNLKEPTQKLLDGLFGSSYQPHLEDDSCCGGAGTFGILHRDLAQKITAAKLANIQNSGAAQVVTSCPACLMQLGAVVKRLALPLVVKPLAVFLEEAMGESR
ncbi:(Fe-S)-binding protein [Desulfofundulus salinus]|nr:(Fe-S)-binding protein [Desulfofundulus salinum]